MRALGICIVSTTPSASRKGNRVTALRWSRLLRDLGHQVRIEEQYRGRPADVMIALHARRSYPSVERFLNAQPDSPVILALTGTDLYEDIHIDATARRALTLATRLVVLQPLGLKEIPQKLRGKGRVIFQSAIAPRSFQRPARDTFDVCVLAHLRPVKDPFRAVEASRLMPPTTHLRILQVGGALSRDMADRAEKEARRNHRYNWLGELPRARALSVLARSRLLVLSSLLEGGANAITEAIACGVPVLSSRIPGSIGLLGADYSGYFAPGDTEGLARLLHRAEEDGQFLAQLRAHCVKLAPIVKPQRERECWARLLNELSHWGRLRERDASSRRNHAHV